VLTNLSRRVVPATTAVLLVAATAAIGAQRVFNFRHEEPERTTATYDGRFAFARLWFTTAPGGYYYRGLPAWAHGFPRAERNLVRILNDISYLTPHLDESNVFKMDDPELFKFPIAYMTEAGFWDMNDREAAGLRAYLEKGGFVIFDDFRPVPYDHGGGGWEHFEDQMRRVLPQGRFVDLDPTNPIFHSFFEIDSFDIVPQMYDAGKPIFRGLFEDNDPSKRLIAMVNLNTDVADFWEFSARGFVPVEASNEAYKLGINYIIYGMTH
jgi:Domain of unknown function (DUF4159)